MSDAEPPDVSDDGSSRRRLLTLLGGVLLALLGAGFGASNPFAGDDTEDTTSDPGLSVQYTVTPDRAAPTPTPTPEPGDDPGSDGQTVPPNATDVTTAAPGTSSGDGSDPDDSRPPGDGDRNPPAGVDSPTPVPTPANDLTASAIPPVSLSDVAPGDGGVVDLALSLSGTPARLWVRGDATDFDEGGVVEAERSDGDGGPPGELQEYVEVRLWYDGDAGAGDRVVYEGPLAGLGAVSEWTPLTDSCVDPGTHPVRFRWDLPADAPNRVQTDSVSFSLDVAADASECV
ncbi:hypothetical protein ACFR97_00930 [Haloplanus litoreus]|uniref:SipW-cognate class signal peptide n=1 Tax=Haloplanus litoreus TaxID=767515 RepID=A0ABD5ZV62_9EURY